MRFYHEMSGEMIDFEPRGEDVTLYICGITPYDTTHLGHAFTYATFDILIRYLEYQGLQARYVQNVTDIDDDILRKAKETGDDWLSLGNRWTSRFIRDMQALNMIPPDYFPRATDVIDEIVSAVQKLLDAGMAYEAGGSVYFHVDAWPDFGKLSKIQRSEMLPIANERGNFPDDPHKQDPLDFVLWQAQAPGEPAWPSPWGAGRPGWHIECSTMASKHLGDTVDFHGGGTDLIFPHHECEIVQAEVSTGQQPFVRFWLHTAMVYHEGEKMSKSLGNLVMISDLLQDWSPDSLRIYLAAHHYRESWSYAEAELREAASLSQKILAAVTAPSTPGQILDTEALHQEFLAAMDNDLDTPGALQILDKLADAIVDGSETGLDLTMAQEGLRGFGRIFGLRLDAGKPEAQVVDGWNRHLSRFLD